MTLEPLGNRLNRFMPIGQDTAVYEVINKQSFKYPPSIRRIITRVVLLDRNITRNNRSSKAPKKEMMGRSAIYRHEERTMWLSVALAKLNDLGWYDTKLQSDLFGAES